jgi:hypothetical protein
VIKAPVASAPPAVVVKLHVAAALVLAATRSDAAIENEVLVTWPPIAGTATPAKVSTGANPELTPKVDIVEVVAAAAALGVVRPETTHTTAAFKATGLARTSFTLGEEYVAVIVPVMAMPALVHDAVRLLPMKEVKPVKVITSATVADAPVNPTVMVETVEMTLLGNET